MAGSDRARHALRIVLEEIVVGKKEIHRCGNRAGAIREKPSNMVEETREGCELKARMRSCKADEKKAPREG